MNFLASLFYTLFYTLFTPVAFVHALVILTFRMWLGLIDYVIRDLALTWRVQLKYPDQFTWRDVCLDIPHMLRHEIKEPWRAGQVDLF